jgi:hypothetical protein
MEEEIKRKMAELALAAARKRVSPQTGFLHFWPDDPFLSRQDTIPLLENFLYAYALFRSKQAQNIQEAKALLDKLLIFEVSGNFPVYLHEFPETKDRQLSAHLLPVFFYLLKDFSLALGEGWTQKLEALCVRILKHLRQQEGSLGASAQAKMTAFQGCFDPETWHPKSPAEWAEFCLCAQMSGLDFEKAAGKWDSHLAVFIGEAKERAQEETEPAVTLLDLFMGAYFGTFSKRALVDHPIHLKACLVHPFQSRQRKEESKENGFRYLIQENQRQSLMVYWGSQEKLHSLVLEAKKGEFFLRGNESEIECLYTYPEELPSEEESTELSLYLNDAVEHDLAIEGQKATVFHLGEEVSILSEGLCLAFRVEANPEEGTWMGHILKGDRSYQKSRKQIYGGYDWKLGLRTIQRKPSAQIRILLKIRNSLP